MDLNCMQHGCCMLYIYALWLRFQHNLLQTQTYSSEILYFGYFYAFEKPPTLRIKIASSEAGVLEMEKPSFKICARCCNVVAKMMLLSTGNFWQNDVNDDPQLSLISWLLPHATGGILSPVPFLSNVNCQLWSQFIQWPPAPLVPANHYNQIVLNWQTHSTVYLFYYCKWLNILS